MSEHPTDLLPEYVDRSLPDAERDRVRAHVAACARCRAEVRAAATARAALRGLPELVEPAGTTLEVLRRVRPRRPRARRAAWIGSGVAAAAAAVLAFGVFTGGGESSLSNDAAVPAQQAPAESEPERQDSAPAPEAGETADDFAGAAYARDYPAFTDSGVDHDPESLNELIHTLVPEARAALEADFPPTARDFYRKVALGDLEEPLASTLECASRGVDIQRTLVPFVIEASSFRGRQAFVVVFLEGPDPDARYDRLVLWVVDRERCTVGHYARELL